jgi:uncharacterized protein YbjQ (UPF0145 family)
MTLAIADTHGTTRPPKPEETTYAAPSDVTSSLSRTGEAGAASRHAMIVTTTENVPEARVVKTLGQVFGLTVRSRSLGGNIVAFLKSLIGGEIRSYVKLNEDARRQAIDRMVQNAAAMGANAVTMMRFDSTEMGRNMSEIVAYGTARVVDWTPAGPDPAGSQSERSG